MKIRTLAATAIALGMTTLANAQYAAPGFVIPDNAPAGASSNIVIADGGSVGAGLAVGLSFVPEHTWAGDLVATLSHNDGTTTVTADLFRRIGKTVATTGFGNSNDLNGTYTFTDSAATSFWNAPAVGGNVTAGSYRAVTNTFNGAPGAVVNLDSIFGGRSLAGTWTLKIVDEAAGDSGSLAAWTLTLPAPGALAVLGLAGLVGSRRRRA